LIWEKRDKEKSKKNKCNGDDWTIEKIEEFCFERIYSCFVDIDGDNNHI
jgi:hypothetical protein